VCLIGTDKLLLYDGIVMEGTSIGMDPLNWTTLPIPSMYLIANWPIRFAATSNNGQFIAIAGKRGLAHYNCASEKWKLFGNEHQVNRVNLGTRISGHKSFVVSFVVSGWMQELA
jgi:hypothetical protein